MTLQDWAAKWGVSATALRELADATIYSAPADEAKAGSESRQQSLVRLEAARKAVYLFRNNVGAGTLENGSYVRWGLANDSEKVNAVIKSGDLIGWRSRLIKPSDVGSVLAQFISREVKRENWKWSNTPENNAQLKWAALVNAHGGDAAIVTGPGSL
jgi:hypothetical protein